MGYIAKNNAYSTLAANVDAMATEIIVQQGHGERFTVGVGDYTFVTLEDASGNIEVCKLVSVFDDTLTVVRAQDGTTARSWYIGDIIECRPCAAAINAVRDEAVSDVTHVADAKSVPDDTDELPIVDSNESWRTKKLTWANLKVAVKTYFDTLYSAISHNHDSTYAAKGAVTASGLTQSSGKLLGRTTNGTGAVEELDVVSAKTFLGAGNANGLATLDGNAHVPTAQLGTGTANSTTFLRGDQTWQVVTSGGLLKITRYDAAGTYSWNKLPSTNSVYVKIYGAGGGGGGGVSGASYNASDGGYGGSAEVLITSPNPSYPVVIGSGGVGGSVGSYGGTGGATSFGSTVVYGGGGGAPANNSPPTSGFQGGYTGADYGFIGGGAMYPYSGFKPNCSGGKGGLSDPNPTSGSSGGDGYIEIWEFA